VQCSAALTQCDILDRMSAEAGVPGAVQTVLIPTNIDETPGGALVLFIHRRQYVRAQWRSHNTHAHAHTL
jgi:hypothetical protein